MTRGLHGGGMHGSAVKWAAGVAARVAAEARMVTRKAGVTQSFGARAKVVRRRVNVRATPSRK
eukprot:5226163-Prymnesium_polylepis.1